MKSEKFSTRTLDHLGIVAGICEKIQLVQTIDMCVEPNDRDVSVGEATLAMA